MIWRLAPRRQRARIEQSIHDLRCPLTSAPAERGRPANDGAATSAAAPMKISASYRSRGLIELAAVAIDDRFRISVLSATASTTLA